MRVAFHFDAGRFGSSYGFQTTVLLFRRLLDCIPSEQRDFFIRRGDLLTWDFAHTVHDLSELAHAIFRCSREIWSTFSEEALATALRDLRVWVLAVEGLTPSNARCIDSRLSETSGYLGAIEIHLANRTHWAVYDRKPVAAYRVYGDDLRLLAVNEHLDPEARDECRIQEWINSGLFSRVEWEDIGLRDTVFDDLSNFNHARRVADIEDRLGAQFGPVVGILLMRLAVLDPHLPDALHAALSTLAQAQSEEQIAQASLSCRRFIERLADALYPARSTPVAARKLGRKEYRNRLWAYIEEHFGGEERSRVAGTFQELGDRLDAIDKRANKHIHEAEGTRADAHRLILTLTVWTYDVLMLTPPPKKASIAPHRDAVHRFVKELIAQRKKNVH